MYFIEHISPSFIAPFFIALNPSRLTTKYLFPSVDVMTQQELEASAFEKYRILSIVIGQIFICCVGGNAWHNREESYGKNHQSCYSDYNSIVLFTAYSISFFVMSHNPYLHGQSILTRSAHTVNICADRKIDLFNQCIQ